MAILNIFEDDAFSLASLTESINLLPTKPGRLGELGYFQDEPITQPAAAFEYQAGQLYLIPSTPRGVTTRVVAERKRELFYVPVPHLALDGEVMADDVSGVRAFGTEDQLETVSAIVERKLQGMKDAHEATQEYLKSGAIQGIVLDADGTRVLANFFTLFGIAEKVISFDFADTTAGYLKFKALDVLEWIDDHMGGFTYSGVRALCGKTFYRNLISHVEVSEVFRDQAENAWAREQQRQGFEFAGIFWEPYRAKVGSVNYIDEDVARFIPENSPQLFVNVLAPADYIETVNTPGLEYYAKQKPNKWETGIDLQSQSNPLPACLRPSVLVKGTDDTAP